MPREAPAARAEHAVLVAVVLVLPSLSLIPLGGLYLWEKGFLLWWALAALASIGLLAMVQRHVLGGHGDRIISASADRSDDNTYEGADARWSRLEQEAWADVEAIAQATSFDDLTNPNTALAVATRTIAAVATRLHADSKDAVWKFTLPEALAMSEQVSRRLSTFTVTHIPFGERLTVAQILGLYRARHVADIAGKAYDVWRVVRLVNPATAVTNEARERLTKAIYNWGRAQVTRRLVDAYVGEVGRAAIDLYGGRLRQPVAEPVPSDRATPRSRPVSRPSPRPTAKQAASAIGRLTKAMFGQRN